MNKITGLVAAPFTPMNSKGEIVYETIPKYSEFLVKNKVSGAFINGTTGEGVSLTIAEKRKTTETWTKAAKDTSLKVINLVGGTCYEECIENALHSAENGVYAIALIPPYYFKPPDVKVLVEFCAKIAEAVPAMPVYYYHIPVLTGCSFPMVEFLKQAESVIPNLAGIKFTHEDLMDFFSCTRFEDGKFDMLWGRDENLLSALVLGIQGMVGSTYNYAAPLYLKLVEAVKNGNLELARDLQYKSVNMIRLLGKYGGMATGKAYMKYIGLEVGKYRLPVKNMPDQEYVNFCRDVGQLGIGNLLSKV